MSVKVKVSGGDKIAAALQGITRGPLKVKVGILEGGSYSGGGNEAGASIAQVAAWHEYGTSKGIPARAPFRTTLEEKRDEWVNDLKNLLAMNLQNPGAALTVIGEIAAHDIQAKIESGSLEALKESTIREKTKLGYPHAAIPLVRTGEMMNAISSQLVDD